MKGFFEEQENLEKLRSEIVEWRDTPYKHWTGVKGKGADCIHFIVRVYDVVGATKGRAIVIPKYPHDWHLHNGQALLVDGVRRQFDCEEVDPKKPIDGDLILFQFGLHEAHGGLYLNNKVHQALTGIGVQPRRYTDKMFYKRMRRAFRIRL